MQTIDYVPETFLADPVNNLIADIHTRLFIQFIRK